jgi:hypothetical protein
MKPFRPKFTIVNSYFRLGYNTDKTYIGKILVYNYALINMALKNLKSRIIIHNTRTNLHLLFWVDISPKFEDEKVSGRKRVLKN